MSARACRCTDNILGRVQKPIASQQIPPRGALNTPRSRYPPVHCGRDSRGDRGSIVQSDAFTIDNNREGQVRSRESA